MFRRRRGPTDGPWPPGRSSVVRDLGPCANKVYSSSLRGSAVRKRSTAALLVGAVLAISVTAAGLVSLPGVGGAAGVPRTRLFYLSLGDSYSVGYQPGKGETTGDTDYGGKHTRSEANTAELQSL